MTCNHCGQPMTGRRRKYCNQKCGNDAYTARRVADGRLRAYRQRDDVKAKAREAARSRAAAGTYVQTFTCERCGTEGITRRGEPTRFCSSACAGWLSPRIIAARRLQKAAAATTGGRRRWVQGDCIRCGASFCTSVAPGPVARHCSAVCRQRDKAAERRARESGVRITRVRRLALLERDAWTCYLCEFPIDRTVTAPHPESAVLDHVIPLAAGGPHSEDNLRAAHWMCNALKGAMPLLSVV